MADKTKYHQWFSEMKISLIKFLKITGLIFSLLLFLFIITSCSKKEFQRPTRAYYVNDFAEIFSSAVKKNIIQKSEDLYDISKQYKDNGGAQIVFASFLLDNEAEINSWETKKTELFRQWKIGKNDMGLFVLFFFIEEEIEGLTHKKFIEPIAFEVGYKMDQYLTSIRLGNIYDSINFNLDFDMAVTELLHELLKVICLKAYNFEKFDSWEIAKPGYQEYFNNYVEEDIISSVSMSFLPYLFSPYSSLQEKLLTFFSAVFIVISSGKVFINRGKGGSSGGGGLFRRRR